MVTPDHIRVEVAMVVADLNSAKRVVAIAERTLRERLESKGFTAAEMGLVVTALESKGE